MAGHLIDRLILDRVNETGRKAYWIGQIVVAALALLAIGLNGMGIGVAFLFAIVWGFACMAVWPREFDAKPVPGTWCPACRRSERKKDRCMICGGALETPPSSRASLVE